MGKPLFNLTVVVATRNRLPELRRMLRSLEAQLVNLREVIIVDGSDIPLEGCFNEFEDLPIRYVRCFPPSAAKQRNEGIRTVRPESKFIGFLDDDVILEPGALLAMREFWQSSADNTGGAAFNMSNHPPLLTSRLKKSILVRRLGLYSGEIGKVSPSGFQTTIGLVSEDVFVDWLPSGAAIWRRSVFERVQFDEWFEGYSYLEDLEFSYRMRKDYRLAVVAKARYQHFPPALGRGSSFVFGRREVRNRLYFVRKNPPLSLPRCYLALVLRMVMSLLLSVREMRPGYLARAAGNWLEISRALVLRTDDPGHVKG
jgi:GT2 family glycosyltransferase